MVKHSQVDSHTRLHVSSEGMTSFKCYSSFFTWEAHVGGRRPWGLHGYVTNCEALWTEAYRKCTTQICFLRRCFVPRGPQIYWQWSTGTVCLMEEKGGCGCEPATARRTEPPPQFSLTVWLPSASVLCLSWIKPDEFHFHSSYIHTCTTVYIERKLFFPANLNLI